MSAPMPFEAPVTTATFPASFLMFVFIVFYIVRYRTMRSTKRRSSDLFTGEYETEKGHREDRPATGVRSRSCARPRFECLLAQRLRRHFAHGPDEGDADQSPQPLRSVRQ